MREDGHHSSEHFLTEPGEVVDEKCQLTDGQNQQDHHHPQTRHGTPLDVRDVQHVRKLQEVRGKGRVRVGCGW